MTTMEQVLTAEDKFNFSAVFSGKTTKIIIFLVF